MIEPNIKSQSFVEGGKKAWQGAHAEAYRDGWSDCFTQIQDLIGTMAKPNEVPRRLTRKERAKKLAP